MDWRASTSGVKRVTSFQFKIPTLPKKVYFILRELGQEHGVTNWHVVLMALRALTMLTSEQQRALRDEVMSHYPVPGDIGTHDA